MNKQKEILELKKLYLTQFEKFETKVFLSWFGIFLSLFVGWIYGKIEGLFVLIIAIFTIVLSIVLDCWRKNQYNKVIIEIESGHLGAIS